MTASASQVFFNFFCQKCSTTILRILFIILLRSLLCSHKKRQTFLYLSLLLIAVVVIPSLTRSYL